MPPAHIDPQFAAAIQKFPHLKTYVDGLKAEGSSFPKFEVQLKGDMAKLTDFNILYPTRDPIFIHVFKHPVLGKLYHAVEPILTEDGNRKMHKIMDLILKEAPYEAPHATKEEFAEALERLMDRVTVMQKPKLGFLSALQAERVQVSQQEFEDIRYFLRRNLMEHGPLEPVVRDPFIEDVHSIGSAQGMFIVHKVFGMMETNIKFRDELELDEFLRSMSERIGKPVSDARPIIDGSLPDGSRINIVYSEDVSRRGPSFTIRKFSEKPLTIVALVKSNTLSPEIAAYLWLCLENGMSMIVSGETASGKTTTLNGMLTFINHNKKVFSAEDTPEVIAPQPVWQRLVTRDTGQAESRVELFDLVRAALRSRPEFIIVGEVRGKEGNVMFQAMQTGHPCITTFHAPSTKQMIQRFTGDPINVPIRFIDNLNVAVFQQILYEGGRLIRRVIAVDEILRYSKELDGVMTRTVFKWDPMTDMHEFRGINNSYILEDKISPRLKYEDRRLIYEELKMRAKIIKDMVDRNIMDYDTVNSIFRLYYKVGVTAMLNEIQKYGRQAG